MRIAIATFAAIAGLAIAAGPAVAKSPPKGKYGCTIGGYTSGILKITGKDTYFRNDKDGKYKAGNKKVQIPGYDYPFTGYTIKFKSGSFKGYKGHWYIADSGTAEIALANPIDGFVEIYCDEE
jgi:hypothetical protein